MFINRKGQSTVEYIILVAAVIAVMLYFAANPGTGFQGRLAITYNNATSDMQEKAKSISSSHREDTTVKPPPIVNPMPINPLVNIVL